MRSREKFSILDKPKCNQKAFMLHSVFPDYIKKAANTADVFATQTLLKIDIGSIILFD